MLLSRRNEGLEALLRDTLDQMKAREKPAEPAKPAKPGRAKPAAKTGAKGKGKAKA
jgi:centromere protein S